MFKNYLKIALRNLRRNKGYTFINVAGLAAGIACCVLIALFVQSELSYDRFHEHADRIYRVATTGQVPNAPPDLFALTSRPVGTAIREQYPEAEAVVRLSQWNPTVKHEGQYFDDDDFVFAEPEFFEVFTFPLLQGDPQTALTDPYTIVLTEAAAVKYFGEEDPMGRSLTLNDTLSFTITGITADVPDNSHFTFDILASWITNETFQPVTNDEWLNLGSYAYVLLGEGTAADAFEAKISDLIMRNFGEQLRAVGVEATLLLEPLTDIYLHSERNAQIGPTGDIRYVWIFAAIATFVLLIACINFMNLATARSVERAKEVGVRKVVGSGRMALIRQFLSESILLALIALLVSIGLIAVALPFFNDIAEKEMSFWTLLSPAWLLLLVALALTVGLLAGSYPAFALSRFRPVDVLKGAFRTSGHGVRLRQGLVVFQFAISVALIVGTSIVIQQLQYMKSRDLGFNKEQIVVVDANSLTGGEMSRLYRTVKQELKQHPSVSHVSASSQLPGRGAGLQILSFEGLAEGDTRRMQILVADHDYLETMGIEIVAGRDFSEEFGTDQAEGVLINEAAVRNVGWSSPEEAIGKWMNSVSQRRTIMGVFRDYHHFSLKENIEPMVILIFPGAFNYFSVQTAAQDIPAVLDHLEQTWSSLFPGYTFEHFFLDDDFNDQYAAEERLTQIFGAFAFLAILIACLGLFGLASFITAQRTKEIGVRKVLGATVTSIVLLLSKDFAKLVVVSLVVAAPLAYFAMDRWLEDFPYRVGISPGVFIAAGAGALLIAVLTVSYQSIRAALADPVKSLRYE